jgi:Skp family chaperone for outer membrane proteins
MSGKTEGGDTDWAKLERETLAAVAKPFNEELAKSNAKFTAMLKATEADLAKSLAEGKKAEKQALEERSAMKKLPDEVRGDIQRSITAEPVSLPTFADASADLSRLAFF